MAKYDLATTSVGTLLDDPEVVNILERHVPGITSNPMIGMARSWPAQQVISMAGSTVDEDAVAAITAEIEAL